MVGARRKTVLLFKLEPHCIVGDRALYGAQFYGGGTCVEPHCIVGDRARLVPHCTVPYCAGMLTDTYI